jgi:hypothetical protein
MSDWDIGANSPAGTRVGWHFVLGNPGLVRFFDGANWGPETPFGPSTPVLDDPFESIFAPPGNSFAKGGSSKKVLVITLSGIGGVALLLILIFALWPNSPSLPSTSQSAVPMAIPSGDSNASSGRDQSTSTALATLDRIGAILEEINATTDETAFRSGCVDLSNAIDFAPTSLGSQDPKMESEWIQMLSGFKKSAEACAVSNFDSALVYATNAEKHYRLLMEAIDTGAIELKGA